MTWKYEDYFFAHTYLPTVNPKLPTGFTSLRARPTFNPPAYSFTGVRAYTHTLYINKPEMQKINKFAEEVKTHCTSFTGILVVDCIINVGKISVHKLPISRQRNAQQERKCRSDFHPFWSNNQQSSSRWASVVEEGEKRAQKTKTKKPRKKVPRQCDFYKNPALFSHVSILLQWFADSASRARTVHSTKHTSIWRQRGASPAARWVPAHSHDVSVHNSV